MQGPPHTHTCLICFPQHRACVSRKTSLCLGHSSPDICDKVNRVRALRGTKPWALLSSFLTWVPEKVESVFEPVRAVPASHLRIQRPATSHEGAHPQGEGHHVHEGPSRDGRAVAAPLRAGFLSHISRWQVWEGEEGGDQSEPRGEGGVTSEDGGLGDDNQNHLCDRRGKRKGQRGAR